MSHRPVLTPPHAAPVGMRVTLGAGVTPKPVSVCNGNTSPPYHYPYTNPPEVSSAQAWWH